MTSFHTKSRTVLHGSRIDPHLTPLCLSVQGLAWQENIGYGTVGVQLAFQSITSDGGAAEVTVLRH